MANSPRLVVRTSTDVELPMAMNAVDAAPLLGRTPETVRSDCEAGLIPALPRGSGERAHWRIPTAWILDQIRVEYEIVAPREPEGAAS
jgi:hypothetical protein